MSENSLEFHCFKEIRGSIDREIYKYIMSKGICEKSWNVLLDIPALTGVHCKDEKFTYDALKRLERARVIIYQTTLNRNQPLYLLPYLKDFVPFPASPKAR